MIRIIAVLFLIGLGNLQGTAQEDPPRIRLQVVWPDGRPVLETPVTVMDEGGEVVLETRVKNGLCDVLDLGFGLHTIRIGGDRCASTELKNIDFYLWEDGQEFKVVFNMCMAGGHGGWGCRADLRIRTEEDLPAVNAEVDAAGASALEKVDRFGRFKVGIAARSSRRISVMAPGYPPCDLELMCPYAGRFERTVVLRPEGCVVSGRDNVAQPPGR